MELCIFCLKSNHVSDLKKQNSGISSHACAEQCSDGSYPREKSSFKGWICIASAVKSEGFLPGPWQLLRGWSTPSAVFFLGGARATVPWLVWRNRESKVVVEYVGLCKFVHDVSTTERFSGQNWPGYTAGGLGSLGMDKLESQWTAVEVGCKLAGLGPMSLFVFDIRGVFTCRIRWFGLQSSYWRCTAVQHTHYVCLA